MSRPYAFTSLAIVLVAAIAFSSPVAAQGLTWDGGDDDDYECSMTDHSIRAALTRQGYSQIKLNVPSNSRVQAQGTKDGVAYSLQVNTCNGRVYSKRPRGAA